VACESCSGFAVAKSYTGLSRGANDVEKQVEWWMLGCLNAGSRDVAIERRRWGRDQSLRGMCDG
jgi:hypothetical protein